MVTTLYSSQEEVGSISCFLNLHWPCDLLWSRVCSQCQWQARGRGVPGGLVSSLLLGLGLCAWPYPGLHTFKELKSCHLHMNKTRPANWRMRDLMEQGRGVPVKVISEPSTTSDPRCMSELSPEQPTWSRAAELSS